MPKTSRRYAMREFTRNNKREPDMSNVDDIIDLIFFAEKKIESK